MSLGPETVKSSCYYSIETSKAKMAQQQKNIIADGVQILPVPGGCVEGYKTGWKRWVRIRRPSDWSIYLEITYETACRAYNGGAVFIHFYLLFRCAILSHHTLFYCATLHFILSHHTLLYPFTNQSINQSILLCNFEMSI